MPPTENVFVAHVTRTLRTLPLPTVPLAFATVQVCDGLVGCVRTVTWYVDAARLLGLESEAAVRGDREIVAAVLLQHQAPSPAGR